MRTKRKRSRIAKSRMLLGDVVYSCDSCGRSLRGDEMDCPGCGAELRDEIDLQLEPVAAHLDSVLYKHHPEAVFDLPGGFCDNDGDEEP